MAITTQLDRIMDVEVTDLHQTTTIAIGSPEMVDEMMSFVQKYSQPL